MSNLTKQLIHTLEMESQPSGSKLPKLIYEVCKEVARLEREIEILRQYGNKDCTAMADEVLNNE